jgi:hypothetical protein
VEATGEDSTIPQFNSFENTPPPKYSIFDLTVTHSTCFEYKWCSMVPAEHIKTVLWFNRHTAQPRCPLQGEKPRRNLMPYAALPLANLSSAVFITLAFELTDLAGGFG